MGSELNAALAKLQGQLPHIPKGETGKVEGTTKQGKPFSYTYSYADLHGVSAAVLPLMSGLGLAFTARPTINEAGRFVLAYSLLHESGESLNGEYLLPDPERFKQQDIGGFITYARRYCLCAVTGVAPAEDDDDAQAASKAKPPARQQRPQRPPARPAATPVHTQTTGAEHERLRHGTVEPTPDDRPAARTRGPLPDGENPWQDMPPEEQPGSATGDQIRGISIVYSNMGFKAAERDHVHAISEQIIGRPLSWPTGDRSHKNLSFTEAAKLKDTLDSTDRVRLEEDLAGVLA